MMKSFLYSILWGISLWFFASCSQEVKIAIRSEKPSPWVKDYADIIIPSNIAPINFFVEAEDGKEAMVLSFNNHLLSMVCKDGAIIPELNTWKDLLAEAKGKQIKVEHCIQTEKGWEAYQAFEIKVAEEDIDPYLAYRLIPPGYEMWNEMGIYQRNLTNFEETAILNNTQTDRNCMNCHSFCMQNPEQMQLHLRAKHAGTMLIQGDEITKLETKTEQTISALVYPYWHPSGKFITYSVNDTKQLFHTHHQNRIEVMDLASDVVVYDVEKNEIVTTPSIFSTEAFETFPSFSPDGKTLY